MIKSELSKTIKSTKGKIVIGLILGMPFLDFLLHVYEDVIAYGDYDKLSFGLHRFLHPTYAGFLSGSSIGNFLQISFFWMLPLYFLILYSDSYTTDLKLRFGYRFCLYYCLLRLTLCAMLLCFMEEGTTEDMNNFMKPWTLGLFGVIKTHIFTILFI